MTIPVDTSSATKRYVGQSLKRREDPKYLTGQSHYTDDLTPSGTLYAAIVRSPYAHARIASINVEEARRRPGVVAAYLASDYPAGLEPGLEEQSFYDPVALTSPFGSYVAVVEVDAETGEITIERFVAVDDCGNIINPLLATGQVHGGLAQGIGQALFEGAEYNEQGQLLTGTLMDYAIPRAEDLPTFETDHTVTPTPVNTLGIKGIGEAGAIGAPPAIVNAVVDALAPFGIRHLDMPLKPEKVWQAIQRARKGE